MSSAKTVFMALQTFNRPATRLELSTECGLDRDAVHAGLRRLKEMGVLTVAIDGERLRGLYSLTEDAERIWSTPRSHYIPRESAATKIAYKRRKPLGIELGGVQINTPEFPLGECWKGKK